MLTPDLAGALRALPHPDTAAVRAADDAERALFDALVARGYARAAGEPAGYTRSAAGSEALARFDTRLAAEHRRLLGRLGRDPAAVASDPAAAAGLRDLLTAGLVTMHTGTPDLTIDGELLGRRAALDFAALRADPNILRIFRALDGGRITVDDAQYLMAERRRQRPLIDRVLDALFERAA